MAENLTEFKQQLIKYRAIIGFDYGEKRLGVAVSDLMLTIATPYTIIKRGEFSQDLKIIKNIIAEKEVGAIVYGLPLQMDGNEGEMAQKVREFALKLNNEVNLPYFFWDERLSSSAMEKFLIKEADLSRSKRKNVLDATAASYILQGVLDALQYINTSR